MIIDTQRNIFNIMASTNANWFIYYFKRIPLIGRFLPDSIYGNIGLKKKVAVLATILSVLGKLFGKALFIGLLMVLPTMLMADTPDLRFRSYLHIFFMLNFIGSFTTSAAFAADRNKYICIRLMHMDPKQYIVSTVLFHNLTDILYFLPVLMLSTVLMGGTISQGILLTVLTAALSFIGEAFHLLFYSKTGIMLSKKAPFSVFIFIVCAAASYVPVFLHKPLVPAWVLFSPVLILACCVLGALSAYAMMHFGRYNEIAVATLTAADFIIDTNKAMGEARFSDVAMHEKEFTASELKSDRFAGKRGFAYLNAIFFERHRRLLVRPVIIRLVIIALLFAAGAVASFFAPDVVKPFSESGKILPVFVFIMYFVSIGERICKAMFYNCDISLLRYSFYREKGAVLSNFKVRLFRVAGLNLIVAAAISAAVVGLASISGMDWPAADILFFVLSILSLSLFFSVHHLFLYYVFQPYTTELGMKNPFYSAINSAVYLLCFFCLKIKSAPSNFTLIVLVSTAVYIVIALILVYKYAPKTFRVK